MILQIIKLKSNLPEEELLIKAKERESQFKDIPGLLQKYYVKTGQSGQYGGIYIWESQESLNAYRESDLAKSIPEAYEIIEAPSIEMMD
ncbi:MAG: YdhR family protein, partial [Flavobacteriales bacterium]|nr:YdhR family protein [Flavobacteriales bacterium]